MQLNAHSWILRLSIIPFFFRSDIMKPDIRCNNNIWISIYFSPLSFFTPGVFSNDDISPTLPDLLPNPQSQENSLEFVIDRDALWACKIRNIWLILAPHFDILTRYEHVCCVQPSKCRATALVIRFQLPGGSASPASRRCCRSILPLGPFPKFLAGFEWLRGPVGTLCSLTVSDRYVWFARRAAGLPARPRQPHTIPGEAPITLSPPCLPPRKAPADNRKPVSSAAPSATTSYG